MDIRYVLVAIILIGIIIVCVATFQGQLGGGILERTIDIEGFYGWRLEMKIPGADCNTDSDCLPSESCITHPQGGKQCVPNDNCCVPDGSGWDCTSCEIMSPEQRWNEANLRWSDPIYGKTDSSFSYDPKILNRCWDDEGNRPWECRTEVMQPADTYYRPSLSKVKSCLIEHGLGINKPALDSCVGGYGEWTYLNAPGSMNDGWVYYLPFSIVRKNYKQEYSYDDFDSCVAVTGPYLHDERDPYEFADFACGRKVECRRDRDCDEGEHCTPEGICEEDECSKDSDCDVGEKCDGGECVEDPDWGECRSDDDCPTDYVCIINTRKCKYVGSLPKCQSDEDCRVGEYCNGEVCVPEYGECQSDEDCPSGKICNDGLCISTYCGDGICGGDETCETCPEDCGECPAEPYCGDGVCDWEEMVYNSCPEDCEFLYCGDGKCTFSIGENYENCPQDCPIRPPPQEDWMLYILTGVLAILLLVLIYLYKFRR